HEQTSPSRSLDGEMAQPADGAPDGLALRPVRAVHGNGARAMSAQIVQLPRRNRGAIRVECVEGDWLVIYDGQGWPQLSREAALQETSEIAAQVNAVIIVQAPTKRLPRCMKGKHAC